MKTPPGSQMPQRPASGPLPQSHRRARRRGIWKPRTMKRNGVPGAPPSPSRAHRVKKINGHRERQMMALMQTGASSRWPLGLPCSGAQLSPGCHLPLCVLRGPQSSALPTLGHRGARRSIPGRAMRLSELRGSLEGAAKQEAGSQSAPERAPGCTCPAASGIL